jgi:hypothetical protein
MYNTLLLCCLFFIFFLVLHMSIRIYLILVCSSTHEDLSRKLCKSQLCAFNDDSWGLLSRLLTHRSGSLFGK